MEGEPAPGPGAGGEGLGGSGISATGVAPLPPHPVAGMGIGGAMVSPGDVPLPPMKLYSSWEVEEGIPSAVTRTCHLTVTKLEIMRAIGPEPRQDLLKLPFNAIVLAASMLGSRRALRSGDIAIVPDKPTEIPLDLEFNLQYPHFLKGEDNELRVAIQRRKRYRHNPIRGYKTLCSGKINMAQVLQQPMRNPRLLMYIKGNPVPVARLHIGLISTQPVGGPLAGPMLEPLSDTDLAEEYYSFESGTDDDDFDDNPVPSRSRFNLKKLNIKNSNLKAKFNRFMKGNRIISKLRPSDKTGGAVPGGPGMLNEFDFDDDDDDDDDDDMDDFESLAAERMSTFSDDDLSLDDASMQRGASSAKAEPRLRPFYKDHSITGEPTGHEQGSAQQRDGSPPRTAQGGTAVSPASATTSPSKRNRGSGRNRQNSDEAVQRPRTGSIVELFRQRVGSSTAAPAVAKDTDSSHAQAGTISLNSDVYVTGPETDDDVPPSPTPSPRGLSPVGRKGGAAAGGGGTSTGAAMAASSPDSDSAVVAGELEAFVLPPLAEQIDSAFKQNPKDGKPLSFVLIDSNHAAGKALILASKKPGATQHLQSMGRVVIGVRSFAEANTAVSSIIGKIFANRGNSSSSAVSARIGLAGGDEHVQEALRAYVEQMSRIDSSWHLSVMFNIIPLARGDRLAEQVALSDAHYRAQFLCDDWFYLVSSCKSDSHAAEKVARRILTFLREAIICLPLEIGEAMINLEHDVEAKSIPFVNSVQIGDILGDDDEGDAGSVPTAGGGVPVATAAPLGEGAAQTASGQGSSPPTSPKQSLTALSGVAGAGPAVPAAVAAETPDLQLDYWNGEQGAGGGGKPKDGGKSSIKAAFAYMLVSRLPAVEEPGSKRPMSAYSLFALARDRRSGGINLRIGKRQSQVKKDKYTPIKSPATRIVCSIKDKSKCQLSVLVDGVLWDGVKFFALSLQWPGRAKHFPVAVFRSQSEQDSVSVSSTAATTDV